METRVLVRVRLSGGDLALLRREELAELGQLRRRDALGGEGRDRGLDEAAELDDVGERMAARDEAHERSREIVGRGLADEGAAAGSRLDNPEELECPERLANGRPRYLELLGELALRGKLVAGAEVALLEETLDLLDDSLVEAAPADRFDDCQVSPPVIVQSRGNSGRSLLWSGGQTRRGKSSA